MYSAVQKRLRVERRRMLEAKFRRVCNDPHKPVVAGKHSLVLSGYPLPLSQDEAEYHGQRGDAKHRVH